jgi:hypothetical protein
VDRTCGCDEEQKENTHNFDEKTPLKTFTSTIEKEVGEDMRILLMKYIMRIRDG